MEHDETELTPALRDARERRIEMRDALIGLEAALSAPAPGRESAWRATVADELAELANAVDEHVRSTEGEHGLYAEILELASNLSGKVRHLRDEHPKIQATIAAELEMMTRAPERPVDEVRDQMQRLMGTIVRHRQHGADLVWEAYSIDIGGMG